MDIYLNSTVLIEGNKKYLKQKLQNRLSPWHRTQNTLIIYFTMQLKTDWISSELDSAVR